MHDSGDDDVVVVVVVLVAGVIDRVAHHAEVIALKGDSYRLKDHDLGRTPTHTVALIA